MYTHEIGLDFFVTFLGFDHLGNFLLSGFGSFFLCWVGLGWFDFCKKIFAVDYVRERKT